MDMISLHDITKSFGDNRALHGISLTVGKGEFMTVIGRSGCGKTTMLKIINELLKPDSGRVLIKGENIVEKDIYDLRRSIGYVIQNKGLFPHMTVEKNITYVLTISGHRDRAKNRVLAEKMIDLVDLEHNMLTRYPDELSGGQQQRVGIARALVGNPEIVLMDEPFSSLDEITKKTMQDVILELQKKLELTIVFITHDIAEAFKLGDRVTIMDKGKILQIGSPHAICSNPADDTVRQLIGSYGKNGVF